MTATKQIIENHVDEELIKEALAKAEQSTFRAKVIDTISLYKALGAMKDDLSGNRLSMCNMVINEISECLRHFVDHSKLPLRHLSVNSILEVV